MPYIYSEHQSDWYCELFTNLFSSLCLHRIGCFVIHLNTEQEILIDQNSTSSQTQTPNQLAEVSAIMRAIDPHIKILIQNHLESSTRWMPHEVVPWGDGEDYNKVPWSPEQSPFSPGIVTALETNLLTEDNLPYYHAIIAKMTDPGSALSEWTGIWTAEEATHSAAIRDYMLLRRVMDPEVLERNRLTVMKKGFHRTFNSPFDIFAYTSAQELSTRISHLETGRRAGDPVLHKILSLVSRDENFHYIFYRSVVKEILSIAPELMLPAIATQFYGFGMPGGVLEDFKERAAVFESENIFGPLEYRDHVVKPILKYWKIDQLRGLPPHIEKIQERILKLENVLTRTIKRSQ
jgi:acyl-[acyl-carrier-protein] desaturase